MRWGPSALVLVMSCGFKSETPGHDAVPSSIDAVVVDGMIVDGPRDGTTTSSTCATDPRYDVNPGSGIRYRFSATTRMWAAARTDCESDDAHLVALGSGPENTYVDSLSTGEVWIGYSDTAVEGTWVWVTGEGSAFVNWRTGAPNNGADTGLGPQNCGELDQGAVGTWNDDECDEINAYVCECPG